MYNYMNIVHSIFINLQRKFRPDPFEAKKCSVSEPEPLGAVLFFLEPESKLCYFRLQLRLKVNCKTHERIFHNNRPKKQLRFPLSNNFSVKLEAIKKLLEIMAFKRSLKPKIKATSSQNPDMTGSGTLILMNVGIWKIGVFCCQEQKKFSNLLYLFRFGRHLKSRNYVMVLLPVNMWKKILYI